MARKPGHHLIERRDLIAQRVDLITLLLEGIEQSLVKASGNYEMRRRARAVVDERYKRDGSWEDLSRAIADLADIVGGGEPERGR